MQQRAPVVLDHDEGEAWWFNNDLLTFKATGAQTGGAFLAVEELARRGKLTPLHVHPDEDETFFVVEGQAAFHLDGQERTVGGGSFASVPRGVPHAYCVTSEVARILILVTPGDGAMEEFFRLGGEPARERVLPPAQPLDLERIGAAAQQTGAVRLLGPPPFAPAG
ncbi:MAG TPA: quercetin 2,3-dioxygenase [Baekduia sp.]|nr:quercetin 2,3-dioxygenase [Baekduia sp.]